MRSIILAAPLLALAAPAQAAPVPEYMDPDIARAIPNPDELADIGDLVGRVMGAMLDVQIGGVLDAIDPYGRDRRSGSTIRDLAGPDDPYLEERMRRSIDVAATHAGDVMTDIAILTPRLRRSFEDMSRDIEDATRDLPSRR